MSARLRLSLNDFKSIGIGSGVAGGGALVAAMLIENFSQIADYASSHASTWSFVVALFSVLVNIGKKFLSGGNENAKVDSTSTVNS